MDQAEMTFSLSEVELMKMNSIETCKAYLHIFIDYLLDLIVEAHGFQADTQRQLSGTMWLELMVSNALAIDKLLEGTPCDNGEVHLNPIIDNRMICTLTRTLLENFAFFRHVFVNQVTEERKDFLYDIFVAAGYKEQLDVFSPDMIEKNQEAYQEYKTTYEDFVQRVRSSSVYQGLSPSSVQRVENGLSNARYQYYFDENGDIQRFNWIDCFNIAGINHEIFDDQYKYLSNQTHPSDWGMRQFITSFSRKNPAYVELICTAVKFAVTYLSIFCSDFISQYPEFLYVIEAKDEKTRFFINEYKNLVC